MRDVCAKAAKTRSLKESTDCFGGCAGVLFRPKGKGARTSAKARGRDVAVSSCCRNSPVAVLVLFGRELWWLFCRRSAFTVVGLLGPAGRWYIDAGFKACMEFWAARVLPRWGPDGGGGAAKNGWPGQLTAGWCVVPGALHGPGGEVWNWIRRDQALWRTPQSFWNSGEQALNRRRLACNSQWQGWSPDRIKTA